MNEKHHPHACCPSDDRSHCVLFYEDGAFPDATVADYLWAALEAGGSALIIATALNGGALRHRLASLGAAVQDLERSGRLVMLDAHDALRRFMAEGRPDRDRFLATIGATVDRAIRIASNGSCRAFGEMVGVLVDQGEVEAAIELERLWNELLATRNCGLYCAYPMRQFAHRSLAEPFLSICDEHSEVMPVPDGEFRADHRRCIASMQQQAQALRAHIAERLRAEEALERHRDHLEAEVRARTEELRSAKEKAELANAAKSAFLASMSHELRTPLSAILGYAQLLQREPGLEPRVAARVVGIQQSGQHLLTLINELLDLARIEAGKLDLCPEPLNPAALLGGVADIVRVRAEEKDLLFDYRLPPGLPAVVVADGRRLRQVLLNLLANAVRFTDRGTVSLTVALAEKASEAVRLRFEVGDTGIGIAPAHREAIFQPFAQVGDAARRGTGSGLGLAISRELVRLMGGELRVESAPGEGSRFWFELVCPVSSAVLPEGVSRAPVVGYEGPRRSVLVADDAADNRRVVADLLSGLGFSVAEAANGKEALERIAAVPPDLVVMDLVMPVMGGLEAICRLRGTPALSRLPVIAVSASASGADRDASLAAGADAFLTKPIDEERFLERIGGLLGLDWRREPVGRPEEDGAEGPMFVPPPERLDVLRELAMIGNMRSIRDYAGELIALDQRYRAFAGRLDRLARNYQSRAILAMAEGLLATQGAR